MDLQRFEVGKPLAYRDVETRIRNQTLMLLEWDNSGYILIIALPDMTEKETAIIKKNRVRVHAIAESGYILPVWHFTGSQLFGETPFDPTAYRNYIPNYSELLPKTNLVTIIGVDSATMVIKALRAANLPSAAVKMATSAWESILDDTSYSSKYARWVDDLTTRYSIKEILELAKYIGRLGDA